MQEGQAKEHFAERFGGGNLIKRMGKKLEKGGKDCTDLRGLEKSCQWPMPQKG